MIKISKETSLILKGLSAMAVLLNHIYAFGGGSNILLRSITHRLSDLGMCSFLFISGYGIYCSYCNFGLSNYWDKKFDKFVFPIFFSNIMGALVNVFILGKRYNRAEVYNGFILRDVYYPAFNGILWYMHFLLLWYVLFYLIEKFIRQQNAKLFAWLVGVMLVWYITPEVYGLANVYCLAFPGGVVYAWLIKNKENIIKLEKWRYILLLISICAYISMVILKDAEMKIFGYSINFFIYTLITNVLLLITLFGEIVVFSILEKTKVSKFFIWIGKMSFAIYLFQDPLIITPLGELGETINKGSIIIIGGGLCLLISWLYTFVIKGVCKRGLKYVKF